MGLFTTHGAKGRGFVRDGRDGRKKRTTTTNVQYEKNGDDGEGIRIRSGYEKGERRFEDGEIT